MSGRTVEISGMLEPGMWDYNDLHFLSGKFPRLHQEPIATVARDGYDAWSITLNSLHGTYLETSAHMLEHGVTVDQVPLADLFKPAAICHVPDKQPRQLITAADLQAYCPPIQAGDALLIDCGWGRMWNQPGFVADCPNYARDALQWILDQPITLIGVDVPCIEPYDADATMEEDVGSLLGPICEKGLILLAPVAHLHDVRSDRGRLIAFPLAVRGVSSAPCRAVVIEE